MTEKVCYITFPANPGRLYAYYVGNLRPVAGDLVVVMTAEGALKIVNCVGVADSDHKAVKQIFGLVAQQPKNAPLEISSDNPDGPTAA